MNLELSGDKNNFKSPVSILLLISFYVFINILFVWKYASPYFSNQIIAPIIYLIVSIVLVLLLLSRKSGFKISSRNFRFLYGSITILSALFLTVLMLQFEPGNIGVGRYPAQVDWITKLFNGEFPYESTAKPSGFPFLFILALPFYFLGDAGVFQIFSFLILAAIFYFQFRNDNNISLPLLILLVISPIFIFEIVVRSDLFSNIVMVLLYLILCEKYLSKKKFLIPIGLGLLGGFLLSTRSIVLVIFILYFVWKIRDSKINPYVLVLSMITGFLLTLLPFAVWDWDFFLNYGPLAVQMSYVPGWFIILSIIFSFIWAVTIKNINQVYFASATMLFCVVFGAFVIFIARFGIIDSVINDQFDISYFCFPLPFLLMSLGASAKRCNANKGLS